MTDYGVEREYSDKLPVTLKWRQLFTSQHYISTEGCTSKQAIIDTLPHLLTYSMEQRPS